MTSQSLRRILAGLVAVLLAVSMGVGTAVLTPLGAGAGLEDDEDIEGPEEGDDLEDDELEDDELDDDDFDGEDFGDALEDGGADEDIVDVNVAFDLRLESAAIVSANLDDDEQEFVRYTFVEPIDEVADENLFALIGVDSDEVVLSDSAFRDEDDRRSVLAGFPDDTDVFSFPLAAVGNEAVTNISGESNVRDTARLEESTVDIRSGRTNGPDLVNVRRQSNLERAEFIFDENLDEDSIGDAREFGFFTLSGDVARGDSIISVEDEVVTVFFDEEEGNQVEEGARFFVLEGAAEDRQGNTNPMNAIGAETAVPDLADIDRVDVGSTQFDFVFDQDISDADVERFFVYTASGVRVDAESVARPDDGNTVRVGFPEIEDFGEEIILGAVLPGAVGSDDASGSTNTVGAIGVAAEELAGGGATIGPDLESVDVDDETGQIVFVFDEDIDDDQEYDEEDFLLVTDAGLLVPARSLVESDQDFVVANFDEPSLDAAVGATIRTGAVQDFLGNASPLATADL